ncbi:MAG: hypothetical protein ACQEVA_02310 [Myxococcota bacterium]
MSLPKSPSATFIGALLLLAFLWPVSAAAGDPSVTLELVVPPEKAEASVEGENFPDDTLKEITTEAAERIRKRLRAAEIKHWDVVTSGRNQIRISVYSPFARGRLASILVPAGEMSIHPVLYVGDKWTEQLSRLPEGVELRQPDDSMRAEAAFLWSRSRRTLNKAIAAVPLPGVEVNVYPYEGGWRTVAMGSSVATHRSIQSVSIEHGNSGDSYVRLNLDAAGAPEESTRYGSGSQWALVLDGEIVRSWHATGETLETTINLRPPRHLGSKDAQSFWSQQVAGRLAAHIPVPLVEVEDFGQD